MCSFAKLLACPDWRPTKAILFGEVAQVNDENN